MTTTSMDDGPGASLWAALARQRWGAIAGAIICFLATAKLMFSDVNFWQPSTITNDQAASMAALAVAILAAHYCWTELKALSIWGVALLALALAASWYVVTTSAGRTSESRSDAILKIQSSNDIRSTAKGRVERAEAGIATANADLKVAQASYREAQKKLSAECGTGKGKLCTGHIEAEAVARQAVREARDAVKTANEHYEEVQTKFSALPAPRVENGGYKHTAAWLASLPFVTTPAGVIADLLATQIPGLLALICEFGVVTFTNVATRKRTNWQPRPPQYTRLPPPTVTEAVTVPVTAKSTVASMVADPVSVAGNRPKPKRQRPSDIKLVHDAIERLGGEAESQDQLAEAMAVHKSEAHKRIQACGDFVVVEKVGKCNRVRINTAFDYI